MSTSSETCFLEKQRRYQGKCVQALRNRMLKRKEMPLVIEHETYTRHALKRKLGLTLRDTRRLFSQRILCLDSALQRSKRLVVNTHSLAAFIALVYERSLREALIRDPRWEASQKAGYSPREHIQRLWNAYQGSMQFESFKERHAHKRAASYLPQVREWYVISRYTTSDWLISCNQTVSELSKKHLIIPRNGKSFLSRSLRNHVHTEAFAQLLSLLYHVPFEQIYLRTEDDGEFQSLLSRFFTLRVLPCLLHRQIGPWREYAYQRASEKTGLSSDMIRDVLRQRRLSWTAEDSYAKDALFGIDLALFSLKQPYKQQYTREDIAVLFGIRNDEVSKLHLPLSDAGFYGTRQYVYPLYDVFASSLRSQFFVTAKTRASRHDASTAYFERALHYYGADGLEELVDIVR